MTGDRYDDYDPFADLYDRNWGFFASGVRPTLDRLGLNELPDGATVIDLCCGTGHLAASLSDRFRVLGIDGSAAMIARARANAPRAEFIVDDARGFRVDQPAQAVVCTFDSLNHLMSLDDLEQAFRCVRAALIDGGAFIFDLNMERGYEERWSDGSLATDVDRIEIRGEWDPESRIAAVTIEAETTTPDGEATAVSVRLTQRCYDHEDVVNALHTSGFPSVTSYDGADDLGFGGVGRTFFVAR